jgi:hypothetical protein
VRVEKSQQQGYENDHNVHFVQIGIEKSAQKLLHIQSQVAIETKRRGVIGIERVDHVHIAHCVDEFVVGRDFALRTIANQFESFVAVVVDDQRAIDAHHHQDDAAYVSEKIGHECVQATNEQ